MGCTIPGLVQKVAPNAASVPDGHFSQGGVPSEPNVSDTHSPEKGYSKAGCMNFESRRMAVIVDMSTHSITLKSTYKTVVYTGRHSIYIESNLHWRQLVLEPTVSAQLTHTATRNITHS